MAYVAEESRGVITSMSQVSQAKYVPYAHTMEWRRDDGYRVTDDRQFLDFDRIHHWLSEESYWAMGRSMEVVRRSVEGSIPLGCYADDGTQVAVCRWVTDSATFGWLCDVFVDRSRRGQGLGKFLVSSATAHPAVQGVPLLVLGTRDAQHLYSQFGFVPIPEPGRWMERRT